MAITSKQDNFWSLSASFGSTISSTRLLFRKSRLFEYMEKRRKKPENLS